MNNNNNNLLRESDLDFGREEEMMNELLIK